MQITLASTSPYRKALLQKLNLTFECASPNVDESSLPNESASDIAERLAIKKAQSVGISSSGYIIGSDQVACVGDTILGKPGNHQNAFQQLSHCSEQTVMFYTGLCLLNTTTNTYKSHIEPFQVKFKKLSTEQIEHYLDIEQPYNCAGSFKSEGLGILLFDTMNGRDPNALVGLPLIALNELFAQFGIDLLSLANSQ
jgi:septum formation protein